MMFTPLICLTLLIFAQKISSINFGGVGDNGLMAGDCDFPGNDITNMPTAPMRSVQATTTCSIWCQQNRQCTHWTWTDFNFGTCWLKTGPVLERDAVPLKKNNQQTGACGILGRSRTKVKVSVSKNSFDVVKRDRSFDVNGFMDQVLQYFEGNDAPGSVDFDGVTAGIRVQGFGDRPDERKASARLLTETIKNMIQESQKPGSRQIGKERWIDWIDYTKTIPSSIQIELDLADDGTEHRPIGGVIAVVLTNTRDDGGYCDSKAHGVVAAILSAIPEIGPLLGIVDSVACLAMSF